MSVTEMFIFLRKHFAKRQGSFAELLDVNQQSISDVERGIKKIPYEIMEKLAGFDVNINWLLCGKGEPFFNSDDKMEELSEPEMNYGNKEIEQLKVEIDNLKKRMRLCEIRLKMS